MHISKSDQVRNAIPTDKEFTMADLTKRIKNVSKATISNHLSKMLEDGTVEKSVKEGNRAFVYSFVGKTRVLADAMVRPAKKAAPKETPTEAPAKTKVAVEAAAPVVTTHIPVPPVTKDLRTAVRQLLTMTITDRMSVAWPQIVMNVTEASMDANFRLMQVDSAFGEIERILNRSTVEPEVVFADIRSVLNQIRAQPIAY